MKAIHLLLAAIALSIAVHATNVQLLTDKNETVINDNSSRISVMVNDTIYFRIKVSGGGYGAGGFTINKEVALNEYKMIGVPHFASDCTMCRGITELGNMDNEMHFTPTEPGTYLAEASYNMAVKRIYVDASLPTTTTTSSTTSTTTTRPTTTSTTSSSTTTTTMTTTSTSTTENIVLPTTTTIPGDSKGRFNLTILYMIGIVLVLFILFAVNRRQTHD